jgi:hypothetical protein
LYNELQQVRVGLDHGGVIVGNQRQVTRENFDFVSGSIGLRYSPACGSDGRLGMEAAWSRSSDCASLFKAEISRPVIYWLTDDYMIQELDLENPGGFAYTAGKA